MKKIFINKYFYFFVVLFISAYVLFAFVKHPGMNWYERAMVHDMIYGSAWKPFVYRTLLPTSVRIVTSVIPESVKNEISNAVSNTDWMKLGFSKFKWETEYATEYFIACCFMLASLVGFAFTFRWFMRSIYPSPDWFSNLFTYISLLGLPAIFQYYSYLYDFTTLFLFTLGLVLMYKQKWNAFLIVYFLACINKETTILLTMIFAIYFFNENRFDRKLFNKLIVIQLIIFVIVKTSLYFIFINNQGGIVEFHLFDYNVRILSRYSLTIFAVIAGILLLLFYKWNEKPEFLKSSLWAAVPLLVLSLFFGVIDELRDYYEVYPSFALLLGYSAAKILDIKIVTTNN